MTDDEIDIAATLKDAFVAKCYKDVATHAVDICKEAAGIGFEDVNLVMAEAMLLMLEVDLDPNRGNDQMNSKALMLYIAKRMRGLTEKYMGISAEEDSQTVN